MSDVVEALILDLLEWVAKDERSYEEVMDAWRTSCPRLPVWEDANDRGLVTESSGRGAASSELPRQALPSLSSAGCLPATSFLENLIRVTSDALASHSESVANSVSVSLRAKEDPRSGSG